MMSVHGSCNWLILYNIIRIKARSGWVRHPTPYLWHMTMTVWLLASSLVVMGLERLDHLVGRPLVLRNCLTVDALMPKFTFSGIEPVIFANLSLFNLGNHDADDVPVAIIDRAATASRLDRRIHLELT